MIFSDIVSSLPIKISDNTLLTTLHKSDDSAIVTVINHFEEKKDFTLELDGYVLSEALYGKPGAVNPYDACVLKFKKK